MSVSISSFQGPMQWNTLEGDPCTSYTVNSLSSVPAELHTLFCLLQRPFSYCKRKNAALQLQQRPLQTPLPVLLIQRFLMSSMSITVYVIFSCWLLFLLMRNHSGAFVELEMGMIKIHCIYA